MPIWFAARPAPGASSIVSTRSSSRRWIDASIRVTFFAFSRRTGCSKVRIGRTMELDFTRGPIGPNLLDDPARANHDVAPLARAMARVGLDPAWPDAEAHPPPAFRARVLAEREVSSALETIALQRQLPTVLAAETVNEGGRRAHHAYAVDPLFQQAGRECLRRLA